MNGEFHCVKCGIALELYTELLTGSAELSVTIPSIITVRVGVYTVEVLRWANTNLANASTPSPVTCHSLSAVP